MLDCCGIRAHRYERLERTGRLRMLARHNTLSSQHRAGLHAHDELRTVRALFTRCFALDAIGAGGRQHRRAVGAGRAAAEAARPVPAVHVRAGAAGFAMVRGAPGTIRVLLPNDRRTLPDCRLPQTFSYLAFIIARSADKVMAREWTFSYALDEVNTSANRFGEGGAINMVKREAAQVVRSAR